MDDRSIIFEITIPVLNEELKLVSNVLQIHDYIRNELPYYTQWSIVIADNGSTDHTQSLGEQLAREYFRVKYIRLNERGVGLALKSSWIQSSATIVGYMDLDLATHLKHLPEALDAINSGYGLVYGSRLNKKSNVSGRSLKRELVSRSFNFILRNYLGVHFSDGMCGFKFMKKEIFLQLQAAGAKSDGWFFSTELLIYAEWLKFKIFELPVEWTDSKESRVRIIPLTLQYLKSMKELKKKRTMYVTSST